MFDVAVMRLTPVDEHLDRGDVLRLCDHPVVELLLDRIDEMTDAALQAEEDHTAALAQQAATAEEEHAEALEDEALQLRAARAEIARLEAAVRRIADVMEEERLT